MGGKMSNLAKLELALIALLLILIVIAALNGGEIPFPF